MKLMLGILIGLVLGVSAQLGAELLNADGSPYTMWQNGLTPQQYERQQRQDTTNSQLQNWLLNQNQKPC